MSGDYTREEIREMSMKEYRKNLPSGWMEVARYESLALMIDALLSARPSREFTSGELADQAGITEKTLNQHIDSLRRLEIVNELDEDREDVRYTLNERSPIVQRLFQLNRTVEDVKSGDLPGSYPEMEYNDDHSENSNLIEFDGSQHSSQSHTALRVTSGTMNVSNQV